MKKDKFFCVDLDFLIQWILRDLEEQGEIFSITRRLFFEPNSTDEFHLSRYGRILETPLGVAAGPHTQLAQNIVSAYLCGARYIELKTIQVLDDLLVTKPCIDMRDEGYNCEWSQELRLDESFNEYMNAFILLYILKDLLGWADAEHPGFIFNMSAGYNLEGIQSPTVQRFFDRMTDCSQELSEKLNRIALVYPRVKDLNIPTRISDNVTVSTMHGCPPDEVEKIGRYFIEERGFHTTIKLNPTLLGPRELREILNGRLGYETEVPDEAFAHDLKFDDGVSLIKNLLTSARKKGVAFSLKVTNTLETSNTHQNLPKNEKMVYMSGRALHPISVRLASRLQERFDGKLDISFSAGVDCFNVADVLSCGLRPVTVSSDILKPGGYGRLSQYLEVLSDRMARSEARSLDELVTRRAGVEDLAAARLANLRTYAQEVVESGLYKKESFPFAGIKTSRPLTYFNCAAAPCVSACAADQDIPRYLNFTVRGEFEKAFQTILATNPFPHVQGMVCDHLCQYKCTRINYDSPVMIREIKRFIAQNQKRAASPASIPANGKKIVIIGAGPTGMSCAYFLALEGFEVDIYESKQFPGGMAADGIPSFRLDDGSLTKDINAILGLGVRLHTGVHIGRKEFGELRESCDYVYIAVGAQKSIGLGIPGEDAQGIIDQLQFLSAVRRGQKPPLGKRVAVIGGGNSAIDVARTAKRLVGKDGEVIILYRRTREEMPCDPIEAQEAIEEGIVLKELTQPECMLVEDGHLKSSLCFKMKLGKKDASGRPKPIKIEGSEFELDADTIITAIGQRVMLDFLPGGKLTVDWNTLETQMEGVFAGGDAIRGPSSLINAIGDGRRAAESIMKKDARRTIRELAPKDDRHPDLNALKFRQARRGFGAELPKLRPEDRLNFDQLVKTLREADAKDEASRCLQCDLVCNVCVSVCPNRANVAIYTGPVTYPLIHAIREGGETRLNRVGMATINQSYQVVNIVDFCNECGNCETFCPTAGAPYRDKPKVHLSRESFEAYGMGVHFSSKDRMESVLNRMEGVLYTQEEGIIFEDPEVRVIFNEDTLEVIELAWKKDAKEKDVGPVSELAVLFRLLRSNLDYPLYTKKRAFT